MPKFLGPNQSIIISSVVTQSWDWDSGWYFTPENKDFQWIFNITLTSILKCILSEIQTQCGLTDIVAFLHCYIVFIYMFHDQFK